MKSTEVIKQKKLLFPSKVFPSIYSDTTIVLKLS